MSCAQSLKLDAKKCSEIAKYLSNLTPKAKNVITLSKMSEGTGISVEELGVYVDALVENNVLIPRFGLLCAECGMVYEYYEKLSDIVLDEEFYCHYCDEPKRISTKDIIVIFSFKNPNDFFGIGQNNLNEQVVVAAQNITEVDSVFHVATISDSINRLQETLLEIHREKVENERVEQENDRRRNKIKALIKSVYFIVVLIILIVISDTVKLEEFGVHVEVIIFILSFFSDNLIEYVLEKVI